MILLRRRACDVIEIFGVFAGNHRLAVENIDNVRRKAAVELRQQLVANAIAGNRRILVGRIFTELDTTIVEKRAHAGAPCLQERAHDDSRPRMHPAKASRTGPSQQPQKERLSLIVFRVRHGDDGCVKADEGAAKEVVARGVGGVLDRNAVPGGCFLDVDALDVGGDRQTRAQVAAERLVAIGFRAAQLVVQMDRAGHMKIVAGDLPQYQQQTH